jgi:dTDP-4-dehydrorhamnose reductase
MLGTDLCALLTARGETVTAVGSRQSDIRDLDAVRTAVRGHDVVVNAAAWTAVDAAEADEPGAFAVNALGARNVALAAREAGARTVQVSTDYVFDGTATEPYAPDHPTSPRSAYGRTKLAGEWAVRSADPTSLVVRTAWLYGHHGANFVTKLREAGRRGPVRVVADEVGQPTWTKDLARFIVEAIAAQVAGGMYHASGAGQTSRLEFTRAIFELSGLDPALVTACTASDLALPAERPAYSVLAHAEGGVRMPPWRSSLAEFLAAERSGYLAER